MIPNRRLQKWHGFIVRLGLGGVAGLVLFMAVSAWSAQNPASPRNGDALPPSSAVNDQTTQMTAKQKEEPKKSNREMARADAAQLSALADQVRDELNKMNFNVFSLAVVQKTEEIEKLAKKIKGEAHGRKD